MGGGGRQNSWLSFCCHKTVEMRRDEGRKEVRDERREKCVLTPAGNCNSC